MQGQNMQKTSGFREFSPPQPWMDGGDSVESSISQATAPDSCSTCDPRRRCPRGDALIQLRRICARLATHAHDLASAIPSGGFHTEGAPLPRPPSRAPRMDRHPTRDRQPQRSPASALPIAGPRLRPRVRIPTFGPRFRPRFAPPGGSPRCPLARSRTSATVDLSELPPMLARPPRTRVACVAPPGARASVASGARLGASHGA